MLQENTRLKGQFTSQEEDRTFLIKQLVAVKKDNARLRAEYTELEAENENLKQEVQRLTEKLNQQQHTVSNAVSSPHTVTSAANAAAALVRGGKLMGGANNHNTADAREQVYHHSHWSF